MGDGKGFVIRQSAPVETSVYDVLPVEAWELSRKQLSYNSRHWCLPGQKAAFLKNIVSTNLDFSMILTRFQLAEVLRYYYLLPALPDSYMDTIIRLW